MADDLVDRAANLLSEREGRIEGAYLDSLGNPTAGVGHLLTLTEIGEVTVTDPNGNDRKLSELPPEERQEIGESPAEQLSGGDVQQGGYTIHAPKITSAVVDAWAKDDIARALGMATDFSGELGHLYENVDEEAVILGLTSMFFQLGDWRDEFPKATDALRAGDPQEAAIQLLTVNGEGSDPSLWATQTPSRANEAANIFRTLKPIGSLTENVNGLATDLMGKQTQVAARNGLSPDARMMGDVLRYG